MAGPSRTLEDLLTLEPDGDDAWLASTPGEGPRLFGGQVASQSLRAATLTVDDDRHVHSLHAYFIRPGRPDEPLRLAVDRTRDGRSFTTRRVTASQSGVPIFVLASSFAAPEDGDDWQLPAPSDVPDPDSVDGSGSYFSQFWRGSPFEVRPVHEWRPDEAPGEAPKLHPMWVRARQRLPDDPDLHATVLTFFSDMGVVGSARSPSSSLPHRFMGASLDHAVWFHRPWKPGAWSIFDLQALVNAGGRSTVRATMHGEDGTLHLSMAQELLIRELEVPIAFDAPPWADRDGRRAVDGGAGQDDSDSGKRSEGEDDGSA